MTRSPSLFHVKHRGFLPLLAFGLLAVALAAACLESPSPRGWAAAVEGPENTLLVTTRRGHLDAIDRTTGAVVWSFPGNWEIETRAARDLKGIYADPIVANGTVYVADYNGFLYAFRPADLQARPDGTRPPARVRELGSAVIGGMAFHEASNTLFITTDDGRLHAINATDFTTRFEPIQANDRIWGAPTVSGGNVFFASIDRRLYGLEATTGRQVWEPFSSGGSLVTQPVVANGNLLVGGFNSRLYALDVSSGQERWTFNANNWIWSRPLVSGNSVYVADFDGKVYAIDLNNGQATWPQPYDADDSIRAAPALAGGVLLVVTERGHLHGINPVNGTRAWELVRLGGAVHADLVALDASTVVVTPSSCIERTQIDDQRRKVNYFIVDPATGEVTNVLAERGC
jgi:outer membrane protein assembly factor BamB